MTKKKAAHATVSASHKIHVVMAASDFADGGRVDDCLAKVTSPTVIKQRGYHDFQAGLVTLGNQLNYNVNFTSIGVLDIVGHGAPGALEVGIDQWMTADENFQDCLVQFNMQIGNRILPDTVIRLLGCNTGTAMPLPLLSNGDGPVLALSLARRLGCVVQVTTNAINACQFTATGFRCDALLAQPPSMNSCALAAVNPQNPDNCACAASCGDTSPEDLGELTGTLKSALWTGVIADSFGHTVAFAKLTECRLPHDEAIARLWLQDMTGLLARPGPAFPLAFVHEGAPRVLMLALEGWHDNKPMIMLRKPTADGSERLYWLRFD